MDLGPLDRTVTILRAGDAGDDGFNPGTAQGALAALPFATDLPATHRPARGSERFANEQNAATQASAFWVRWTADLADLAAGARTSDVLVTDTGQRFDIKSIIELGRRDGLEIAGTTKRD